MQDDLAKLQGTWYVTALEMDGQTMPAPNEAKIVVEGDRFTSLGMGAAYNGKLVLDGKGRPKSFDLKFTSGPEKGNTNRGIYELKAGRWKICLDTRGKGRPTGFTSEPGSGRAVEVLERAPAAAAAKKAGTKPKSAEHIDLPADPAPELGGKWAMLSCVQSGEPLPEAWCKFGKRTAVGNLITVTMNKQVMMKVHFSVDKTKQPLEIDYVIASGPSAGQKQYGIYELKGAKLTTCIAALGKPRPTAFKTVTGDGNLLTSWSRAK